MISPDIRIERGGILLEPDPSDPYEAEGILNPAVAGDYLLYRAVGEGNYSRIMAATLHSHTLEHGLEIQATKLHQVVLEPEQPYELAPTGRGGIEDPRVTELPDKTFVMFYTAYGRAEGFRKQTPVVAVATSHNGLVWERLGRMKYELYHHNEEQVVDFNTMPNKDTVLFGERINERYTLLHRPMFTRAQAEQLSVPWRGIWYADAPSLTGPWSNHRLLLQPEYEWENGGVGAGPPPIHLRDMWVHIYHGFTKRKRGYIERRYSAGVFLTPHNDPLRVTFRSDRTILEPQLLPEQVGTVPHVVFPTAVWQEDKQKNTLAIFWGAADTRIMWGVLHLPSDVLAVEVDGQHTE